MTYNFDEIIDRRHTNALNTDCFRSYIFHAGPEKVFPLQGRGVRPHVGGRHGVRRGTGDPGRPAGPHRPPHFRLHRPVR